MDGCSGSLPPTTATSRRGRSKAVRQLYEKDQIFGIIGSIGTATAAVAVPYALERRMLFFGAYTGGNVVRRDPPDRYVFNYRPSYAEEADAAVRYLVKLRRIPVRQIAVFAQQDDLGDAGFAGVAKAYRALGINDSALLRLNYARNTIEVDEAVNLLRAAEGAGQGDHHGRLLSGRRQIHREDAQPLSRDDLHQHLGRRRHVARRRIEAAGAALHQRASS